VQETFWGVRRVLEALARDRPLIVMLEDVHWGQPLLLDLVEHLAEWVRDASMLLLVLTRPELRETREALTTAGRRVADVIELAALEPEESRAFVDGMLGRADLPPDLLERILATTEGNPLFLGETLRMLLDDGALTKQGEVWVTAGADTVTVPPTIHALLSARIERLRGGERAVVERASVIGKQFYRGAVAELVTPLVRAGLDGHLETLRRKEMVEPDGTYWVDEPVYRFHHVLLRDAAYRSLLKEARADLHERFADWLTTKAGELVGEHEEVIAYHLEQAHEYRRQLGALDDAGRTLGARAAAMLGSAGRRALARADLAAATNLLGRALERVQVDEPALLWDLAEALLSAGDAGAARPLVERLAGARADVLTNQIAIMTGAEDPESIVAQLAAAAESLAGDGDGVGAAKAHHVAAEGLVQLGRLGAAEAALDRALVAARKAGDRRRTTAVLAAAPRAALWGPSPMVRSSGRCLDVLRILRMNPGNRHVEAIALRCQAVLEAVRGRFDPARAILETARVTLHELGLSWELQELAIHAGLVELLAGDPAAASVQLQSARDGFTTLGVDVGAAQAAALLARALVEQDRDDEAIEQTRFAEQHAGGDLKTTIAWCGARAEALARRGSGVEALALARRAVDLAEPTDALPDKADASLALARVSRTLGRADESRAAAARARELYQAKDHSVGVARATELAGAPVAPAPAAPRPAGVLGDRPPERTIGEWVRHINGRHMNDLAALFAEDIVRVDHRTIGWDDIRGHAALREYFQSGWDMSPQLRVEPDEALACDERVIAFTFTVSGPADSAEGGPFEIEIGVVARVENGLITRWDQYEPDDRRAMIARYAELGGGQGPLGDRPSERVLREIMRQFAVGDIDGLFALYADDFVMVDHRKLGWVEIDKQGQRRVFDSMVTESLDVWAETDKVLACDDRVVVTVQVFRGHASDGGGAFEIPYGVVMLVEDGLIRRTERFEPEDRAGMLARYAELGGRREILGDRPPERIIAEWARLSSSRNLDKVLELFAADIVRVDHRKLGWDEMRGHDRLREHYQSGLDNWPDIRLEPDEVLACDDRVIAFRYSAHGTSAETGGTFEIALGVVALVDNGVITAWDQYEPDARQDMIARYVELGGGHAPLGDRPPERAYRDLLRAMGRQDVQSAFALVTDDYVMVDHRQLGWSETDKQGHQRVIESMFAAGLDVRLEIDEVLACDDRVIAALHVFRGHSVDGGGPFEIANGMVIEFVDGRMRRLDRYEYDDREAMLARFAELTGDPGDVLGDRPPERFLTRFRRLFGEHDIDAILKLYADDHVRVDHRTLGWEDIPRDDAQPLFESLFAASPDMKVEYDEVLACDDRVAAFTFIFRGTSVDGGGAFEIPIGGVMVIEDGLNVRTEQFDHDDRKAMIARYAELGGGQGPLGDRPPEHLSAELCKRWARRDLDALFELWADDYVRVDHTTLGWVETDKVGHRQVVESMFSASPDVRLEVDEVLACDDRAVAFLVAFRGTSLDSGGTFELTYGMVMLIEDGLYRRLDRYDPHDREAMLARFAELGGRASISGDRPVERVAARMCRHWTPGCVDELVDLFTDDVVRVDHRSLGYEEAHGRAGIREVYETMLGVSAEVHIDPEEVLARDDRVLVLRATMRGTAAEGGGEFATPCGYLFVVAEDRVARLEQFEPDDRQAMIARYAELGGGLGTLGDRPPERFLRELARRVTQQDLDAASELIADDEGTVDHRKFAWSETDKQGRLGVLTSMLAASLDVRFEADEVLACDDRVIAVCFAFRGHSADGGGAFEIASGLVYVVEDGLLCRADRYEYEDREAMLARFAELTGGCRDALGERPPERVLAEGFRRAAVRDVDGFMELFVDDLVDVDHRSLAWDETGKADAKARLEGFYAVTTELRFEVDEVVACDDRVIAMSLAGRGTTVEGGPYEIAYGVVAVIENGLIRRWERYEPDDRRAMIARYAALGGGLGPLGDRPPERTMAELFRRTAAHDVDGYRELFSDQYAEIDHRSLPWDEHGKADATRRLQGFMTSASDVRFEVEEVLACDDRAIAMSLSICGTTADGGGPYEIAYYVVCVVEGELLRSVDRYGLDDRQTALARYAELSAEPRESA
jgi:ketosteroid isomerase-like protein